MPTYAQGEKVIWEGIDNDGMRFIDHFPRQIIKRVDNGAMKLELRNGSFVQVVGTDNFDSIRGTNPKTGIFSEFAYQDPRAWGVVSPILKLNGGLAGFNTTPNGDNHAKELYDMAVSHPETWWAQTLTIEDTGLLTRADMDREIEEGHSEEYVQQEYYCSWTSALVGAYYASRMRELDEQGRIGVVPWSEKRNCYTFWDLGMDDTMTIIVVEQEGFAWKIIDCYSDHGKGWEPYVEWLQNKPYRYAGHYVPHDAKNREFGTQGAQRAQTLDTLLKEPVYVMKRPKVIMDKIEAVRWVLPKCYFDKVNTSPLVNALKSYRQKYDELAKKWTNEPLHDWSSHFADAMAYFALEARAGLGDLLLPDLPDLSSLMYNGNNAAQNGSGRIIR